MTTVLQELIDRQVAAALATTMSRTAAAAGEKLADELLADPEWRARMRVLIGQAFEKALTDLQAEPPAESGWPSDEE